MWDVMMHEISSVSVVVVCSFCHRYFDCSVLVGKFRVEDDTQ